jgi:hypothetical protein
MVEQHSMTIQVLCLVQIPIVDCPLSVSTRVSNTKVSPALRKLFIRFCGVVEFANEVDLCGNQSYYSRMGVGKWGGKRNGIG